MLSDEIFGRQPKEERTLAKAADKTKYMVAIDVETLKKYDPYLGYVSVLGHRGFGTSMFWDIEVLGHRCFGTSMFWDIDVLGHRGFGTSMFWDIDVLGHRCFGTLVVDLTLVVVVHSVGVSVVVYCCC